VTPLCKTSPYIYIRGSYSIVIESSRPSRA